MQNRLRDSLREKSAGNSGSAPAALRSEVKSILGAAGSDADKREWVVTNANGKILCTRIQDISSVRATAAGVILRIGHRAYCVNEAFEAWKRRLPADRFALRGDTLLVNRARLEAVGVALSSMFERRRAPLVAAGRIHTDSSLRR
jgi:hypothetical protein